MLAGLPWTFALPAWLPDDAPPWGFALAMLAGGVLMGASAGAVTGAWLTRMIPEAQSSTVNGGTLPA